MYIWYIYIQVDKVKYHFNSMLIHIKYINMYNIAYKTRLFTYFSAICMKTFLFIQAYYTAGT